MSYTYWIQITAGQGPAECQRATYRVAQILQKEAKNQELKSEILEASTGTEKQTYQSVLIKISGDSGMTFAKKWQGTVQWICQSPFRTKHKRKNWFVGVDVLEPTKETSGLDPKDVKFETMRASGPGGQHVNTTDSAVRARHTPTGLIALAREERSQHANKKLALARLGQLIKNQNVLAKDSKKSEGWEKHNQLERGNPIRVFKEKL